MIVGRWLDGHRRTEPWKDKTIERDQNNRTKKGENAERQREVHIDRLIEI